MAEKHFEELRVLFDEEKQIYASNYRKIFIDYPDEANNLEHVIIQALKESDNLLHPALSLLRSREWVRKAEKGTDTGSRQ